MGDEDIAHCPGDRKSRPRFACLGERLADLLIELHAQGRASAGLVHVAAKEVTSCAAQLVRTRHDVGRRQLAAGFAQLCGDSCGEGEALRCELLSNEWNLEDDVQL